MRCLRLGVLGHRPCSKVDASKLKLIGPVELESIERASGLNMPRLASSSSNGHDLTPDRIMWGTGLPSFLVLVYMLHEHIRLVAVCRAARALIKSSSRFCSLCYFQI